MEVFVFLGIISFFVAIFVNELNKHK